MSIFEQIFLALVAIVIVVPIIATLIFLLFDNDEF